MNKPTYNMIVGNRDRLCDNQSKVYRELKRLWFSTRNKVAVSKSDRLKIESLESENKSLTEQIDSLESRILNFQLFGK